MKKQHLFSAFALATVLAGCTSDELINKSQLENIANSDGRISFSQKVGNLTRASQRAEAVGHYEFGVWGYKTSAANQMDADGDVMTNYLVAYGDNETGDTKNYKALAANATTYGADAQEGTTTVAPDGISTWYYEGLGSPVGSHKQQSSPAAEIVPVAAQQSLKYWDKSTAYTNFFAYMPYYGTQNADQKVDITAATTGVDMKFTKAGIFYTDPADTDGAAQVAANKAWAGTYNASSNRAKYNDEIINANEANYAAVSIPQNDYEKDVHLNFLHVNAKIKVAIWEAVPGYKVELIDLVNDKVVAANSAITAEYKDCAFTPATKEQAIEHQNHREKDDNGTSGPSIVTDALPLPSYPTAANITAAAVQSDGSNKTKRSAMSYEDAATTSTANANLRFTIASDDAQTYAFRGADHKRISEVGQKSATVLNTTFYALPNVNDAAAYITPDDAPYASKQLTEVTGYTFHVSYRLLPEDGSAPTEVYDARVWVAPEFCKWQDGKQYTYIFKITTSSNGVTDPKAIAGDIFKGSGETNPYIDPTDPRIPDDPALVPIVFDGITVEDYEATATGHGSGETQDTWQISNVESWPAIGLAAAPYETRYCNYLTNAEVYQGAIELSNEYYTTIATAPTFTFQGATTSNPYSFIMTNAEGTAAYFKAVTSGLKNIAESDFTATNFADVNKLSAAASVKDAAMTQWHANMSAGKDMATYIMYVWSKDDASKVWKYVAEPQVAMITVTPVCEKEVITATTDHKGYQTVTTYTKGIATPEVKYYKANAAGTDWDEISKTAYDAVSHTAESDDVTTPAYTFSYTYAVANDGYAVVAGAEQAAAANQQAYGVVVKK